MLIADPIATQRLNLPGLKGAIHYVQSLPQSDAVSRAQAVAQIVAGLDAEDDVVLGALLYPLLRANVIGQDQAITIFGTNATRIARDSLRIASFGAAAPLDTGAVGTPLGQHAESLRKMLLAIATDPRLVLIRL